MGIEESAPEHQPLDPAPIPADKPNMPGNTESGVNLTVEAPELPLPENELRAVEQDQPAENNEKLQQQFEQAAKLGRGFVAESRQREDKALAPYINKRLFNPEDIKTLQKREQLSSADVAAAKRASLSLCLQAADQISLAKLPRQKPEQALKQRTLEDEIDSLQKIDSMLGAGFRQALSMIKEGQSDQLIQQVRQVIAYHKKIRPDQIKTNGLQVLEWVQNTIQDAGQRVRKHRDQAKALWSKSRGGRQYRDPLYPSR